MHGFPARRETSRTHNRAADGHVRIHVANVVHERTARQARNQGSGNAFDGRIGHRQNNVRMNRERARDRERKIRQIIRYAAAHLKTRKRGGADALDGKIAANFAAQEIARMVFGWIVARPACKNRDAMLLGESLSHLRGEFGRGAGVRRKIFVQQKDVHRLIREKRKSSAKIRSRTQIVNQPSARHLCRSGLAHQKSPRTRTSIFVRRKHSMASSGRQTIGSLSLNEVFSTTGTPVRFPNSRISRQ